MEQTVIRVLASAIEARRNCIERSNTEWRDRWEATIRDIEKNYLPSGSGFDSGCVVDLERSTATRIIITTSYHHMSEHGFYDGWTDHVVTVTPTFGGFDVRFGGRDRDGWKEYAGDVFATALGAVYKGD